MDKKKIEQRVLEISAELMGMDTDEINLDSNYIDDMGLDSLDSMDILLAVEDEFDVIIDDDDWFDIESPRQVVDLIINSIED